MNKIIKFYLHKAITSYFNYIVLTFLFMVFIVVNLIFKAKFSEKIYITNGNNFINTPIYFMTLMSLIINIIFALILAINIYQSNDSWFHSDLIMMTKVKNRNVFILGRMLSLFILIIISSLLIAFLSFIAGFIFRNLSYIDDEGTLFTNSLSMLSRIKQMFSTFIFDFLIIVIFSLLAIVLTLFFKTLIALMSFLLIIFSFVGLSFVFTDENRNFVKLNAFIGDNTKKDGLLKNDDGIYLDKISRDHPLSKKDIDKWKEEENKKISSAYNKFSNTYSRFLVPMAGFTELNHLFLKDRYLAKMEEYNQERILKETKRLIAPSLTKFPFTLNELKSASDNIKTEYNRSIKKVTPKKIAMMNELLKRRLPGHSIPKDYDEFKKLLDYIIFSSPYDLDEQYLMDLLLRTFDENNLLPSLNLVAGRYFSKLSSNWGEAFKNIYQSKNMPWLNSFTAIKFLNDVLNDPAKVYTKYKKAFDEYVTPHYVTDTYEYRNTKLPTRSWTFIYIPLILLTTGAILIYEKKRNFN